MEMLYAELLDQLLVTAGKPDGARLESRQSGGDEIWYWGYYPGTAVRYLVRDRKNFLGFTSRRVVLLRIEPRRPDESPQSPLH